MKTAIEKIDIKKFLPQRAPFLMVDHWLHVNEMEAATAFVIPAACIFVENGQLNESGLVENAAQTCSTIVGKTMIDRYECEEDAKKLIGFISSIKRLKVFALPNVLETIVTKAELISRVDTLEYCICSMKCTSFCQEMPLLECQINLIIQELDE